MNFVIYFFIFLFGSAIGSFLNVVIFRLPVSPENRSPEIYGERFSVYSDRSRCPRCGHILRWYDLIPIISFFVLRGRCRDCRGKISWQYPLVEAATGALFVAIFNYQFSIINEFPSSNFQIIELINLGYWFFIVSCCVAIFVYDLRHYIIPDKILLPAVIVSSVYRLFAAFDLALLRSGNNTAQTFFMNLFPELVEGFKIIVPYLLSAFAAAAFFLFLVIVTRGRGMGIGDVKLVFLMGLVLGWPQILPALFMAFFTGAAAGLALIIAGKKTMQSQIPFGPFLIAGTMAAIFFGPRILQWAFFMGGI